jgi:uncharacterized protein YdeI (YjbR/CyaY-like superfamily)
MPHEDLVSEALCIGCVDSLVKHLDNDRYAIKVTPRKRASKWSDLNRRRWKEHKAAGLLAPAGLDAAPTENRYAAHPPIPELPTYIAKIRTNFKARQFFQQLTRRPRRDFVVWIHTASDPRRGRSALARRSPCSRPARSSA